MKTCLMVHILKKQCMSKDIISNYYCFFRELYLIKCNGKYILGIKWLQGLLIFFASPKKAVNGLASAERSLSTWTPQGLACFIFVTNTKDIGSCWTSKLAIERVLTKILS